MKNDNISCLTFSISLAVGLLVLLILFSQCHTINENVDSKVVENKQRGAHVFRIQDTTNLQALHQTNLEWITLVPWGYQEAYDSQIMTHHNGDSLFILDANADLLNRIALIQDAGFKVFVKPHIWIMNRSNGKWRSDIFPSNEKNWELWKKSYREFIFRYATLAEEANAEMFCIGTELSLLSVEKSVFWEELIQEVQKIYSGKITYAANWYNEYEKITFWDKLDYIGIQAYFPLVKNKYPSVEQISKGWEKYFPTIESIHKKYNRKILFTEMGYKSTADSAIEPWLWMENAPKLSKSFSPETQANCYEAFFNTVWEKEWFAGVHLWQIRGDYIKKEGRTDMNFTPQGKPAENIIAKGFE